MLVKRKRRKGPGQEGLITASPFLMPSLIGLLVFSLLPLLISAFISLTDWNGLDQLTAPGFFQEHFIGLDNYKAILSSPEFWGVLWNTFRYIIMYIPLMLVASLGVAYLLSRQRPGVTAFRIIYYIPVLTSWVAASMIWKSMLSPEYGAVNNILAVFGIQGPGWLLDEAWAMPAIVLVSVWKDMGFFGLILLSGMVGINKSYYEAASLDGAGSWQKFWKITLPLMTPAIPLLCHHASDGFLVVPGLLTAWLRALPQAVVSLGIEQPFFVKACQLELMVHIGSKDKVILLMDQLQQFIINELGGFLVSVDQNMAAPPCPMFFQRIKRVKSPGVHILDFIFLNEVSEVFLEPGTGIGQSRRG